MSRDQFTPVVQVYFADDTTQLYRDYDTHISWDEFHSQMLHGSGIAVISPFTTGMGPTLYFPEIWTCL